MKNYKSITLILLLVNILKINTQKSNKFMKFKEVKDEVNNSVKDFNYTLILSNIISLISDYYVFYDIEKSSYGKKFDILQELGQVKTDNTNYYEFITHVKQIIRKPNDGHFDFFSLILQNYTYYSPIQYYVSTENNETYLKYSSINPIINEYPNKNDIKKCEGKKIIKISNKDPFDYIQDFGKNYILREPHGQFSLNLRLTAKGTLATYPFDEESLTNIRLELDGCSFSFDYLISVNSSLSQINSLYLNNFDKIHKLPISYLPIIELDKKNDYESNLLSFKKEEKLWDLNYIDEFKYKYDKDEKVNVIYISTFYNQDIYAIQDYYEKVKEKLTENKDPIIILLDRNPGGYVALYLMLQKMINYQLTMTKIRASSRKTKNSTNIYKIMFKNTIYDIDTCLLVKNPDDIIEEDKYDNEITHNRSKVYSILNTYSLSFFKPSKIITRDPTDILVFTDGISVSAASFLINDLKESGNAIIAGYNGNPNRKKELFMASNSPSFVLNCNSFKDERCEYLKKNNLLITITNLETFNDSYINKTNETLIPREYQNVTIDYRSNIFGSYNDSKYSTFIKEGKKIIKYFKEYCSPNNINLIKINSTCKFGNSYTHGGHGCGNDKKWNYSTCIPSYCDEGYTFDTKNRKCIKDKCYELGRSIFRKYYIAFILIVLFVGFLLCYYIYKKFKYFEKNTSDYNTKLI